MNLYRFKKCLQHMIKSGDAKRVAPPEGRLYLVLNKIYLSHSFFKLVLGRAFVNNYKTLISQCIRAIFEKISASLLGYMV